MSPVMNSTVSAMVFVASNIFYVTFYIIRRSFSVAFCELRIAHIVNAASAEAITPRLTTLEILLPDRCRRFHGGLFCAQTATLIAVTDLMALS